MISTMRARLQLTLAGVFFLLVGLAHAYPRQDIIVVGSSTVYPFISFVAEYFGVASRYNAPRVESTGTGGGFKYFCQGLGLAYPDINNASRAIKQSEIDLCAQNGIRDIFEINIGLDGLVLVAAPNSDLISLDLNQIYLALARWLPDEENGQMIDNPHQHYSDISPNLPHIPIRVLGPPPTSGTRDSFVELVLESSCKQSKFLQSLHTSNPAEFKKYCRSIRSDGAFIEAGENDNLILRKVADSTDGTLGITGFSYYAQNTDLVRALHINGVAANRVSILSGKYAIARPLFVYIKLAHIELIPGLVDFVDLLLEDFIVGPKGQLVRMGLVTPEALILADIRQAWQGFKERPRGLRFDLLPTPE